jgi:hypothetical protein
MPENEDQRVADALIRQPAAAGGIARPGSLRRWTPAPPRGSVKILLRTPAAAP